MDYVTDKLSRQYKDTLFRTLFGDNKNFLELYNAIANEHFPPDTIVKPYPSNELLAKFNDLAACIGDQLVVFFEHQSTDSINMPLRLLSYATDILYMHIIDKKRLYDNIQVKIPTPKFYVLYNGIEKPRKRVLKLSDAFNTKESKPAMELTAKIIDINLNRREPALTRSTALKGYSFLVEEIRKNKKSGVIGDQAVISAIDTCIKLGVLKEFLTANYREVLDMLNWEYDAEADMNAKREEGKREGVPIGAELIVKLIKDGLSPEEALAQVKAMTHTVT